MYIASKYKIYNPTREIRKDCHLLWNN